MTALADRIRRLTPSQTMGVTAAVEALRRAGVEVIDLGAGEPDFPTPDPVKAAAKAALDEDFTRYTPNAGIADLRRAIADRYRTMYGVAYGDDQVIATAGGKQALYNTALALFGPGDDVIIHTPCWPTLVEQVKLADATPVLVPTPADEGFVIRARGLLDAVTPRTRGIIINSPCNPTGALMGEGELALVADRAARDGIWIVLDLCYEQLIFDAVPHNLPGVLATRCPERAVVCGSASKSYAMTGWRCGWALGPEPVIRAAAAVQSHSTSNVNAMTQKAVIAALAGSQAPVSEMLDAYRQRRDAVYEWITVDSRLRAARPAGAFYLFVDVRPALSPNGLPTSAAFAAALLEEARVAVTPGEAFDAPGFVRLSFATSMERLREGSRRIVDFVRTHAVSPAPAAAG